MDNNRINELNRVLAEIWDSLTDEQKARAKQCGSIDELTALAGEIGIELPNEILDAVAGGIPLIGGNNNAYCPYCGGYHIVPDPADITITPKGGGGTLQVRAYTCSNKSKPFYYYESKKQYYDNNFELMSAKSGCL